MKNRYVDTLTSPIGMLTVSVDADERLCGIDFGAATTEGIHDPQRCSMATKQLREYFAGTRHTFDLPLLLNGTAFQNQVWQALCQIPYGVTISYKELANRVGRPKASRAVGTANGANPIPIVVPCHRVITSDHRLGGYAGGLGVKQQLLEIENAAPELFLEQT